MNTLSVIKTSTIEYVASRDTNAKVRMSNEFFNNKYPLTVVNCGTYVVSSCENMEQANAVIDIYNK
jgi:hypothetical protein